MKRSANIQNIETLSEPELDSEHELKVACVKEIILPSPVNSLVEAA